MQQVAEVFKMLGAMPAAALVALVILAGFGLAAYAISAVVTVSRRPRNGR